MANHGAVTYGSNLLEAFLRTETVEHLAHIDLVAHQLGSPRPLSAKQIEEARFAKARYLKNANIPNDSNHRPESVVFRVDRTGQPIE